MAMRGAVGGVSEPPVIWKSRAMGQSVRQTGQSRNRSLEIELDSRQEEIGFLVSMLVVEEDVAVVAER